MSEAHEPDLLEAAELLAAVMQQADIAAETLAELEAQQATAYEQAYQAIAGTSFAVHAATRTLYVQNFLTEEVLAAIPLFDSGSSLFGDSEPPSLETHDWEPWGSALCQINPHNGSIEGFLKPDQERMHGLVITANTSYHYTQTPFQTAVLAQSHQCLFQRVHKPGANQLGIKNTAYDLYLSEDRDYLCVSDRHAGSIWVIETATYTLLGEVSIRPAGSTKSLNIAFDYYESKAYITDNMSPRLLILSLPELSLETHSLGEPEMVFGNLVRSPDIRYLYLLVVSPQAALHSVNIENEEFEDTIQLKGTPFSEQPLDPCDLMQLTPDQNHLLLITSHPEPTPFTPGLTLIDPHQFQPMRFHSIPNAIIEQTKPIGLVYALPNPIVGLQKSPLELLIAAGHTSEAAIQKLREQGPPNPDLPARSLEPIDLDDPDAPDHGQGVVPGLSPQEAEAISLDTTQAIAAIMLALNQKLYQQSEIDLAIHPEEHRRFQELAEGYRQTLETYDAVEVQIDNILERFDLEVILTRQEILSLMARESLKEGGRPPYKCPACNRSLKGNWDCPTCFLELESPQRLQKKNQSSLDSLGALPRYQVLIADPGSRRLLILDDNKTIDWELKAPELPCKHPWNALWLPNKNILIVDREASRVLECSPGGNVTWELKQQRSAEHKLLNPVKATYYFIDHENEHFLIVDQGHDRVLIVDRSQQLIWQYGQAPEATDRVEPSAELLPESGLSDETETLAPEDAAFEPNAEPSIGLTAEVAPETLAEPQDEPEAPAPEQNLSRPSDFQRTYDGTYLIADTGNHRVIEVEGDTIIRSFGAEQGLQSPIFAQRLFDGDTLIVDADNHRVIEVDPNGRIVSECFYFTEDMSEDMRLGQPQRVFRREKKSVMLMDEDKLIEIQPLKHRLVWSSMAKHLAHRVEIKRDAFDKSDSYMQSFYQYRIPTMPELIERLRSENRLESASGIAQRIFDNLSQLVDAQRELDAQRSRESHATQIQTENLLEIPLYIIDRVNQQVVRLARDGTPLWSYGNQADTRLLRATHISEIGSTTLLIADTSHDRVLEIDLASLESVYVIGAKGEPPLAKPRSATRTVLGNTLIADQGNKRLVEFDPDGQEVWQYKEVREISYPYFALELGKGTILFVDWALHMVKEINRKGELIWSYGQSSRMGNEHNRLASPEYALRLQSGAILIADTGNHRLIEVSPQREILWEFTGTKNYPLTKPNFCQRLANGHTLIAYNSYRSLLEIDREGEACWQFELGNQPLVSRVR